MGEYKSVYERQREAEVRVRRGLDAELAGRIADGAAEWKKKVEGIKRRVRTLLKDRGTWSGEMGYQVELLAVDLLVYRRLAEACASVPVVENYFTREKERRTQVNPLFAELSRQADVVRRDLKSLMMNKELRPAGRTAQEEKGGDALADFIKAVGDGDD